MTDQSIQTASSEPATSWWGAILLGVVFVLAGLFALANAVTATIASAILFGIVLLVAGVSEVIQAFSAPHWRGLFLRILIGALFTISGVMLVADPLAGSVALTLVFGVALIASGVLRLVHAFRYWHWIGPLLLVSGVTGVVAGLVILAKWPLSGLWVLGFLVGLDLLLYGIWWIAFGWKVRREPQSA